MTRVTREAWETLREFVLQHLPPEQEGHFNAHLSRVIQLHSQQKIDTAAIIKRQNQRCGRAEQECESLYALISKMSATCHEHGVDILAPHFSELQRLSHEFDVPLPAVEDFRAQVRQNVTAKMRSADC